MQWKQDGADRIYILTHGQYHAVISHTSTDEWLATVRHEGKVVTQGRFTMLQKAQAWCEQQVGELAGGYEANN